MANDNETVEQVYEEMKEVTGIRRFIDSHYCNHCGDQIDGEGSALDVYADRILTAHNREMAAKDAEIENLKKENAQLRVINCGSIYADGNLREENTNLRDMIEKLTDALHPFRARSRRTRKVR